MVEISLGSDDSDGGIVPGYISRKLVKHWGKPLQGLSHFCLGSSWCEVFKSF